MSVSQRLRLSAWKEYLPSTELRAMAINKLTFVKSLKHVKESHAERKSPEEPPGEQITRVLNTDISGSFIHRGSHSLAAPQEKSGDTRAWGNGLACSVSRSTGLQPGSISPRSRSQRKQVPAVLGSTYCSAGPRLWLDQSPARARSPFPHTKFVRPCSRLKEPPARAQRPGKIPDLECMCGPIPAKGTGGEG